MSEGFTPEPRQDPGADDIEGAGDEGARNAQSTPAIAQEDQEHRQTQHDAPDDDVGGARDEEDRTE